MKKLFVITLALGLTLAVSNQGWAQCATIQDGTLVSSNGDVLETGYDNWGYNYQAHMYNGKLCGYRRGGPVPDCPNDIDLMMKWNDAWLSNKDCDGDGLLDRHFGDASYIGSGAWLTNHQAGLVLVKGKMRKWTYFCKIVAVPESAVQIGAFWYTADGIEIGPEIWGPFAVTQEVSNDPSLGEHGILYKSPAGPGFGIYGKEGN